MSAVENTPLSALPIPSADALRGFSDYVQRYHEARVSLSTFETAMAGVSEVDVARIERLSFKVKHELEYLGAFALVLQGSGLIGRCVDLLERDEAGACDEPR